MSNRNSNFPNNQPVDVEQGEMGALVEKMNGLRSLPFVREPSEIQERIRYYFQWCIDNDLRPGVEGLALALGTTRQTLWNWQREGGKRGELITLAKQVLAALLENWGITGKINPAALCFMMKNHFNYKDNINIEMENENTIQKPQASREEIAARYTAYTELPQKPNFND